MEQGHWGVRLRVAMKRSGINKQLVLASIVKVEPSTVSRWAAGGNISVKHLEVLCETLNVSADWLLFGREPLMQDGRVSRYAECLKSIDHLPPDIVLDLFRILRKLAADPAM